MYALTKRIIKAHPNGFVGATIVGKRGIGKSAYCIKVMKDVFMNLTGCSEEEGYEQALKHIVFDIGEVITFLKKASDSDDMLPVVTWDDASVHGGSLRFFTNMRQVEMLKAVLDTVRTGVTGFLVNCPNMQGLLSVLRNYDDIYVNIIKRTSDGVQGKYLGYERIAKAYNTVRLPSGKRVIYKMFWDYYSCYLPKKVYNEYMVTRKHYFDKAVNTMIEEYKKRNKNKPIPDDFIFPTADE